MLYPVCLPFRLSVRANVKVIGGYFEHDYEVILSFILFKIH